MNEEKKRIGSAYVSTHDIILSVKKRKWVLIAVCLVWFAGCFYVLNKMVIKYTASASFIVNESQLIEAINGDMKTAAPMVQSEGFKRMNQLIYSHELVDHLIGRFDLYIHYHVNKDKKFYYERTFKHVLDCIQIKKTPFDLISVTYNDRDRFLAADMANDIVSQLDILNKKLIISTLEKRLNLAQAIVKDLSKQNIVETTNIDSLISKMNRTISRMDKSTLENTQAFAIQRAFMEQAGALRMSTQDLLKARKLYEWTLQSLDKDNMPTLTVIQKALPDEHDVVIKAVLYSFLCTITFFIISIVILYFLHVYKPYLEELFSRK